MLPILGISFTSSSQSGQTGNMPCHRLENPTFTCSLTNHCSTATDRKLQPRLGISTPTPSYRGQQRAGRLLARPRHDLACSRLGEKLFAIQFNMFMMEMLAEEVVSSCLHIANIYHDSNRIWCPIKVLRERHRTKVILRSYRRSICLDAGLGCCARCGQSNVHGCGDSKFQDLV